MKDALKETPLVNAYIKIAENENGPCVALVSKFKIADFEIIHSIPQNLKESLGDLCAIDTFLRPVLKATVQLDNSTKVTFLVTHLKSKNPSFPNEAEKMDIYSYHSGETRSLIMRAIEAAGLREIIVNLIRDTTDSLMILGDLNDTPRAVTSSIVAGPDSFKYAPLENKMKRWDIKMYSAFDIFTQKTGTNTWYTHIYNGYYEVLDHIYFHRNFISEIP